jgi:phage shock protein PspC (stress-responsive transcriptional regulator)
MNDETKPTEQLEPEPPKGDRPKRLLRSRDDRMLLGVAGGLGRYFGVDPVIIRIGFALSVFIGGLGAFAYAALALFVPTGDADGNVAEGAPIERSRWLAAAAGVGILVVALSWGFFEGGPFWDGGWFWGPPFLLIALAVGIFLVLRDRPEREAGSQAASQGGAGGPSRGRTLGQVVLAIVLAFIALGVLGFAALASAWAGATGHGLVVAGLVAAIGVMLVLSAFRGGARWLMLPAAALAIPLAVVSAAGISFAESIGDREYRPSASAEIPEDGYEHGVGRLVVDLRDLDWESENVVDLDVDLGIGESVIAVPEDVCVSADVSSQAGELEVAGDDADGFGPDLEATNVDGSPPRLDLTGEVDIGVMRVINDDDFEIEAHGSWRFRDELPSDSELRERMDAACAAEPEPPTKPKGAGRNG